MQLRAITASPSGPWPPRPRPRVVERTLGAVEVRVPESVRLQLLPERKCGGARFLGQIVRSGDAQDEVLDLDVEDLGAAAEEPHPAMIVGAEDAPGLSGTRARSGP